MHKANNICWTEAICAVRLQMRLLIGLTRPEIWPLIVEV